MVSANDNFIGISQYEDFSAFEQTNIGELVNELDSVEPPPLMEYGEGPFIRALLGGKREIEQIVKFYAENRRSKLSNGPLQNKKFLFVCLATQCAGAAMKVGLTYNRSLLLSSQYIQECDKCGNISDLVSLYRKMLMSYYSEVGKNRSPSGDGRKDVVIKAKSYIGYNCRRQITLDGICDEVGLSRAYLSTLFKRKTGQSLTEYIHKVRIEEAKQLLRYSDYSCIWIASTLCFSSQSHFAQVFKQLTGMTPTEYRKSE